MVAYLSSYLTLNTLEASRCRRQEQGNSLYHAISAKVGAWCNLSKFGGSPLKPHFYNVSRPNLKLPYCRGLIDLSRFLSTRRQTPTSYPQASIRLFPPRSCFSSSAPHFPFSFPT